MTIPTVNDRLEILNRGADILSPALVPHGFRFHVVSTGKGSGGVFAHGEFVRGDRRMELHLRYSLGLVTYHIAELSLAHDDYMRALLGRSRAGHYPGGSEEPLAAFEALRLVWSSTVRISSRARANSFVSAWRGTGTMSLCRRCRRPILARGNPRLTFRRHHVHGHGHGLGRGCVNEQTKAKHVNYKVLRIIGVVMLVLGGVAIVLQLMDGEKSVIGSIAAGGTPIIIGGILLGRSFRLENQSKASGGPSDTPK